jgi:hypothetical protein
MAHASAIPARHPVHVRLIGYFRFQLEEESSGSVVSAPIIRSVEMPSRKCKIEAKKTKKQGTFDSLVSFGLETDHRFPLDCRGL